MLVILLIFFSKLCFAQGIGITVSDKVTVRSEPSLSSEILVTLAKNKEVHVSRRKGDWYKVRITLQGGFNFDGWVPVRAISFSRKIASTPKASQPKGSMRSSEKTSNLDQFFEPSSTTKRPASLTPPRPQSTTSRPVSRFPNESSPSLMNDRLSMQVGFGYLIYAYELSTGGASPGEVFSYNLSGLGIQLNVNYWVWEGRQYRAGAQIGYQRGFFYFDTALKDSAGTTFENRRTKSSSNDLMAKASLEYRFNQSKSAFSAGLSTGYQYFNFDGDDIRDNTNTGIKLFTSQTTKSILLGLYGMLPFGMENKFRLEFGTDLLLINSVSESPASATGIDPKGKLGFTPWFGGSYGFSSHHHMDLGYEVRIQKYSYSGQASRVNTNNVTDGSAFVAVHGIKIGYAYRF